MSRFRVILVSILFAASLLPEASSAGLGIAGLAGKVGFDVVQSEDTRNLIGGQIDLGNLFGSSLHIQPGFEYGSGPDNQGERKRVASYNLGLKYVLEEEKSRIFGYFAVEIGINAYNTAVFQGMSTDPVTHVVSRAWQRQTEVRSSFNIIPIGLGRKIARNRLKVFSELKMVLGQGDSDTSFRVCVGMEFLLKPKQ